VDNDCDGRTDCVDPECDGDPVCASCTWSEAGQCSDSADNDCDGLVDCADPDCSADLGCCEPESTLELDRCDDGVDNDCDGATDCDDSDCFDDPGCTAVEYGVPFEDDCGNGVDDDGDGLVDEDGNGQEPVWDASGNQVNRLYNSAFAADDDENGYIDDIHGIDAGDHDSDPFDIDNSLSASGHGTHIAGIIAAAHNDIAVAGVAPRVKVMMIKAFDSLNGLLRSDAELESLEYIRAMKARGVNIVAVNASYGCYDCANPSQKGAIAETTAMGIIFVSAAGNGGKDNDETPVYPASYDIANLLSVAATNTADSLDVFSNYGAGTVDLGAPGHAILSTTITTPAAPAATERRTGTSMAAALVSGAIGYLAGVYPGEDADSRKRRITEGTDPVPALAGRTITGGRLNLYHALSLPTACPGDARGDRDSDGLDLSAFIHGGTAFDLPTLARSYGLVCR